MLHLGEIMWATLNIEPSKLTKKSCLTDSSSLNIEEKFLQLGYRNKVILNAANILPFFGLPFMYKIN